MARAARRKSRRGFRPAVNRLEERTLLAKVTWIDPASGDWDTASNWSTGAVPGPSDDVVIATSGITVTHSGSDGDAIGSLTISASDATLSLSNGSLAITVSSSISGGLTISGGTLSTSATLTIGGATNWGAGTITGHGTVICDGGLTLLGTGDSGHPAIEDLDGATLDNAAAASTTDGSLLSLNDGAVFDNEPGSSFTIETYSIGELIPMTTDATDTAFINQGTFLDVANNILDVSVAFDQAAIGSTEVQAGYLSLLDGGTIDGAVTVDGGATVDFAGPFELGSSSSISGAGSVAFGRYFITDTSATIDGAFNVSGGTSVGYGSATFADDATIDNLGANLEISTSNGALNIASSQSFAITTLSIEEGTLSGDGGDITVTGSTTWDGGTISGFGTVTCAGGLTLIGPSDQNDAIDDLDGVTLDNAGAASVIDSRLSLNDGAVIDNEPGGSFTIESYSSGELSPISSDATDTAFINHGTFLDAANNILDVSVAFDQAAIGSIEVQAGYLSLLDGGTIDGAVTVDGGATVDFAGPFELGSSSSISGAGSVAFGRYFITDTSATIDGAFNVSGGTSVGYGSATFADDATIDNLGANLEISTSNGALNIASSQSFAITTLSIEEGTLSGDGGDITVTGSTTWDGGTISGFRTLSIPAAATASLGEPDGLFTEFLDGVTLDNAGTATLSDVGYPTGYSLGLGNGAGVDNQPGGSFTFLTTTAILSDGTATFFKNEGTLTQAGGVGSDGNINVPFNNTGSVAVQQGTLGLTDATNSGTVAVASGTVVSANTYTQTAGATVLNGGTINCGALSIDAGALSGTGTINADVTNGGQVIPGGTGAAGPLQINGAYTQTAAGALDIGIGGATAGSQYARVTISGTASLGGTLNVALVNNFHPAVGNTFQILTFGFTAGNFTGYNGLSLGGGVFLDPVFSASSLTLDADQVAVSGAPAFSMMGVPITVTGSITGPSAGNTFTFSWTVTENVNPFSAGTGSPFSFTPNVNGTYVVGLTVTDAAGADGTASVQVNVGPSIVVLDSSAGGALSLSGNASINLPGEVVVDSNSSSALSASGNATLKASVIDVRGKVQKSGNASFSPAPTTGAASLPDPLAGLPVPVASNPA